MHDVPTHLEVTDKLVFGMTAGQTLFAAASVFVGYSLYRRLVLLGMGPFLGLPIAGLCALLLMSLALVRPEGRSLDQWCFVLLRYLIQPKVCLPAREAGIVALPPAEDEPDPRQGCREPAWSAELWGAEDPRLLLLFDPSGRFTTPTD